MRRCFSLGLACALLLSACATDSGKDTWQAPPPPMAPANLQLAQMRPLNAPLTNDPARHAMPLYPGFDAVYGVTGVVQVLLLVNSSGDVADAKIQKSSGYRDLDLAALQAARQWQFNPTLRDGVPVTGYARVPVRFDIPKEFRLPPKEWPAAYSHPHYVLDTGWLPYASVDDALRAVSANHYSVTNATNATQKFIIRDDHGIVREWWYFFDMDSSQPMAVHFVFAGTAEAPEVRMSSYCRHDALTCNNRDSWLLQGPIFAKGS